MREAVNLLDNETESVVVWFALAVDRVWHGSALIPLAVVLLCVSLAAACAFPSGSWVVLATECPQDGPREAQDSPKMAQTCLEIPILAQSAST